LHCFADVSKTIPLALFEQQLNDYREKAEAPTRLPEPQFNTTERKNLSECKGNHFSLSVKAQ